MSENHNIIDDASEVELTSDELLRLSSRNDASDSPNAAHGAIPARPIVAKPSKNTAATRSDPRGKAGVYVGAAIVTLVCGAAAIVASHRAPQSVRQALHWTPLPEKDPEPIEEPAQPPQTLQPVRIRNAFDASEVFEFPPGTSRQEAREAVRQILLQRAMERQASSASH